MDEVVGEEDETQEGEDGVKLTGTHGMDVEDVSGSGKEGFNGRALVVWAVCTSRHKPLSKVVIAGI
jgi:hypothetical protein